MLCNKCMLLTAYEQNTIRAIGQTQYLLLLNHNKMCYESTGLVFVSGT